MTSSVDSDYNLRSLGRPLIDSASATDSPDPPTTGFSSPDPITNLTLQFSQFTNQMATLISAVSDQNIATSILKEEQLRTNEAISDLRAQIPHNVASGVTFASRDIHAKLQYHAATEAKNYSDTADRLDDLEAAQPDPVLVKLFRNLTSTMEKVNCTLLAFQKSSIEQQQAQLHQQEMSFHKVQAPVEDTFLTLIKSFHSYRQYKSSGGAMIFFQLVQRSPDVLELYLEKARKIQFNFAFTSDDDTVFFQELLDFVFFPDGITIEAFHQLVASKKMLEFSLQSAASFKAWVYFLAKTLSDQLPDALVPQLWDRVAQNAYPHAFQYSLLSHPPRNLKDFAKTIEARALIFKDVPPTPIRTSPDNYRSPPSNFHQNVGTLSSPNHSPMNSSTRRQVAAVTTSTQGPCGNCDNRHHTTITCPHLRFCLLCDRIAADSDHYPSECTIDHSHESD